MNDFYSFDDYSIPLWIKALFWGLYMVIVVVAIWKTLISAPRNKRRVRASSLIVLYFAIYAVFYCVNPDYFSYRDWMTITNFDFWTKEQVYAYLITFCQWVPFDYPFELFRVIVWGGGLLFVLCTAKMYRRLLNPGLVVMFLFVFFSGTYSYARVSLAMAVYFMGVSICLFKKNKFVKLLGITMAVCSYFLHHEMIVGVGVLPCLLFPFEKRKNIFLVLIMLGMMMAVIQYINSNLALMETVFGNDELAQKMETYNEREEGVFRLSTSVIYLNNFLPFLLITKFFYRRRRRRRRIIAHIPKPIVGIYRITFVLLMATVAFFVVSGPRSVYTYRVMYITIIPLSIMITYFYNQGYFKKYQFALILLMAVLTNSVRLINAT